MCIYIRISVKTSDDEGITLDIIMLKC